ncbi:hypothetical protein AS593_07455 [Caulobacter vibrioides]|nr:hypothetical protein AS593_07455 [Caulobacter vibrioides]
MGSGVPLVDWAFSAVLLSLRIAPVFALAPPFTLTRVPATFRALFGVGVAACMASGLPADAAIADLSAGGLLVAAARELALGGIFVMAFQVTFGAIYFVGRTLDIQAGFGLAMLIDPTTNNQTPLIGTLFAYLAGAIFFAMDGHGQLLRIFAATLDAMPLGAGHFPASTQSLTRFISIVFLTGFGVGGGAILCLFLADLAITALSRTVPQMNVLILGLQVKGLLLLVVLPATFGVAGSLLARMMVILLESLPGLL